MYPLRYLPTGHIFIDPHDDCDRVVDAMLDTDYGEEFCLARDFDDIDFIDRLMEAGFLIMSTELTYDAGDEKINGDGDEKDNDGEKAERYFLLLPKLHLERSALFFSNLHIKKSIRPLLSRYELRINTDFDFILDKCIEIHGDDWLTPPLVAILKSMHRINYPHGRMTRAMPVSFGVYREGELRAGEIGVIIGRVYTSYSGYYEEKNAGTVQIILMAQWLENIGFDFLDLGMPLDYKLDLGAQNISPGHFVEIFRAARY